MDTLFLIIVLYIGLPLLILWLTYKIVVWFVHGISKAWHSGKTAGCIHVDRRDIPEKKPELVEKTELMEKSELVEEPELVEKKELSIEWIDLGMGIACVIALIVWIVMQLL